MLEFRTPDLGLIADTRDRLAGAVGSCTLFLKRHAAVAERTRSDRFGTDLTNRKREALETAVRGVLRHALGVSGTELADRFDPSSSTLHQHF